MREHDNEKIPDSSEEFIKSLTQSLSMEEFLSEIGKSLNNNDSHGMMVVTLTAPNSEDGDFSGGPSLDLRLWHQREPTTSIIALYTATSLLRDAIDALEGLSPLPALPSDDQEEED